MDTIVAAATPPGRGAIAIVRVSGAGVPAMLPALLAALPAARVATATSFYDAERRAIDRGLALYFPAPNSYTGEHVLELHGHGGPVLVEALVRRVLELGARRAQPGEFTQRAYLNGKLDLTQAEAVASLIDAASEQAARAALRSLDGELSRRVLQLREALAQVRAYVEAAIDFAEEEIDFLSDGALESQLAAIAATLASLQVATRQGRLLTEGVSVVITGRPNAGKSTLLNRLAGYDAAIVTPLPGTTRDVLRERVVLDGVALHLLDTAGLRSTAEPLSDAIEAEGIRRALAAMARADRILFVVDAIADPFGTALVEERARLPAGVPVTLVINKLDAVPPSDAIGNPGHSIAPPAIGVSALTGAGIVDLVEHLKQCAGVVGSDAGVIGARARHVEALARVATHLAQARAQLGARRNPELVAEELRRAQGALGEIIGVETSDELLGRIFSSFCIGK
jgi:tRNA modification GTPase